MNTTPASSTRYNADTEFDRATAGIIRVVVPTALGDVVAHVNPKAAALSDTATLLLHGAAGSWTTWLPLIRASQEAGSPLQNVVALDLPGWGESGSISAGATVEDLADAVAHVTRTLGYARWDIFGHSLGGHLGLTIAARHPERTGSVTAISATGPGALSVLRHPIRNFTVLPTLAGMLGAMRFLSALGAGGTALVRALHRLRLLGPLSAPLFAHRRSLDRSVIDSLAAEIRPTSFARGAAAAARYDEAQWASIQCPVALVRGDHDVFVSSSDDAWFQSVIPHATQQVSPNAGHFAHIESLQAASAPAISATDAAMLAASRHPSRSRRGVAIQGDRTPGRVTNEDGRSPENEGGEQTTPGMMRGRGCHVAGRAAHHGPIHARDLNVDHLYMCLLADAVSADLQAWIASHSRLPGIVANRAQTVDGSRPTRF